MHARCGRDEQRISTESTTKCRQWNTGDHVIRSRGALTSSRTHRAKPAIIAMIGIICDAAVPFAYDVKSGQVRASTRESRRVPAIPAIAIDFSPAMQLAT